MSAQFNDISHEDSACFGLAVPDYGLQSVGLQLLHSFSLGLVPDVSEFCQTLRPVRRIPAASHLSGDDKQSAHGGYRHQFNELFGSMGAAAAGADAPRTLYYKVEDKSPGRAAHERNVQGPVVVSAMYRSDLLGNASMKQVQALWDLTCVGG